MDFLITNKTINLNNKIDCENKNKDIICSRNRRNNRKKKENELELREEVIKYS